MLIICFSPNIFSRKGVETDTFLFSRPHHHFDTLLHSKLFFFSFHYSSPSDPLLNPDTMTVASKELTTKADNLKSGASDDSKPASNDDGVFSVVYSVLKKVAIVGAIYFVGYMGWSMAWLITPIMFSVTREQWKKSSQLKRDISILSAITNEREVILAKITDLPAWVNFFCFVFGIV